MVFYLAVILAAVIACSLAVRYNGQLRYLTHRLLCCNCRLPESWLRYGKAATLFRCLGVLLNSGVALLHAVEISRNVVTINLHMRAWGLMPALEQLRQGGSFSQAIDDIPSSASFG